jgi:hypothetical protein
MTEMTPENVDGDPYDRPAQTVTLTQHTLGLEPYVLIRAVKRDPDDDEDDGLRLKVEHNNDGVALATLFVLNLPAEQNPITAAIEAVIDANPDNDAVRATLALFAEFCDVPMPEPRS